MKLVRLRWTVHRPQGGSTKYVVSGEVLDLRDDCESLLVKAMRQLVLMIQPLVENAIKHGASGNVGRTTVRLRARVDPLARMLDVTVRDDGVGMDEPTLVAVAAGERLQEASGVGLTNIRQRLALLFGTHHEFDVRSTEGDGTTVHLRMPMR